MKQFGLLLLVTWLFFVIPQAHATRFYFELGAGVAQIREGASFFEDNSPSTLGLGTAATFSFGADVMGGDSPTHIHVGIEHHLSTGSADTGSYAMHAPYAFARMDSRNFFLTAGVAPYVWRRVNDLPGLQYFNTVKSGIGLLAEIGIQTPITPLVSCAVVTSAESVLVGSTLSPKPVIGITALLRLYFGGFTPLEKERKSYGDGGPGDYEGFRYPYGFDPKH